MRIIKIFCCVLLMSTAFAHDVSNYNGFSNLLEQDADERYHDQFIYFKKFQNNLSDSKRNKTLIYNQYWLVNKKQNLWLGFFDGKKIKVPAGVYSNLTEDSYQPQQVIRIKINEVVEQFLLPSAVEEYPKPCFEKNDKIMKDEKYYIYFYSGCTYGSLQKNSIKHDGHYDILLYDKKFNTLVKLDSIPYSIPEALKYMDQSLVSINGYYRFDSAQGAFKITGKDQFVIVDPDTGNSLAKIPKTNDSGENLLVNGSPVMVDDPNGYNLVVLKRLPNVN